MNEKVFKIEELQKIAQLLLREINKKQIDKATVLALSGELGTGKTTITQNIAKILGLKNKIISPTFVIMKIYDLKRKKFKKLIHIDAYRLENEKELMILGWEEMIKDKDNLIILEWPERVGKCLKKEQTFFVFLEHIDDKTRKLKI